MLASDATNGDALHLLGLVCAKRDDIAAAVDLIRRAIDLDPANPVYHANLGNVLKDSRRLAEAIGEYRRALELRPGYAEVHNNLGYALQALGRTDEAIDAYANAIALNPENYRPQFNLGHALLVAGRVEDAIVPLRRAASLNPAMVEAWDHLGHALQRLGLDAEAENCLRRCVQLDPGRADAVEELGYVLQRRGRIDEALSAYERAIALRPDCPGAYLYAAELLGADQRPEDALRYARRAIDVAPDDVSARASALWHAQKVCDFAMVATQADRVLRAIEREPGAISPFHLLSVPGSTRKMQGAAARAYASKVRLQPRWAHDPARFRGCPRIRLGYLSSDFHEHATAYLTAELFELHDRSRFEVFLYSYGRDDGSAMRKRLVRAGDRFVDLAELPHAAAAERICHDQSRSSST